MDDDDQKSRLQQNKTGHGFFKSAFGKADSSDAASDAQAPKDTVAEGDLVVEQFWRNHYEHAFHTATEKIQALEVHIDHLEKVIAELRQSHLITAPRPPRQATPGFAPDGAAHQKELQRIAQQSNREVVEIYRQIRENAREHADYRDWLRRTGAHDVSFSDWRAGRYVIVTHKRD